MASYCGIIHRMRMCFDASVGDYFEWYHNGEIHCFDEETITKLLWPDFKDWVEGNVFEGSDIDEEKADWCELRDKYWEKFLIDDEPFIIEFFDELAYDAETSIGHDSEDSCEVYGVSVNYDPNFGYIWDNLNAF